MLVEHVARGIQADEDGARVSVVENFGRVVQNAPAGNHVVFVAIMLDVGDDGVRGSFAQVGLRIVKMGCCGAEGVDFLSSRGLPLAKFIKPFKFKPCYTWGIYQFRDAARGNIGEQLVQD